MKKRVLLLLAFCFLVVLKAPSAQAGKIKAVATFSILQDFVREVGGEKVEVLALVPFNVDPHSWEPTPKEARHVAEADILFANGAGFDQWLAELQKSAAQPGTPLIVVSEGLVPLSPASGGEHGQSGDPHFWLSVPNAVFYVNQISQALAELAPEEASYFSTRAAEYVQKLESLDARLLEELGRIPPEKRVLITYHNAFSYFAERYGFSVSEFLVTNPEGEPSPRDMVRLAQILKDLDNPVIFSEPQISAGDRYLRALAQEVGARVRVLYSDSLSRELPTYLEMMEYNGRTLREALR